MGACGSTKSKSSVAKNNTLNKKTEQNPSNPIEKNATFTNTNKNAIPVTINKANTEIKQPEINKPADPNPNRKRYKKKKSF